MVFHFQCTSKQKYQDKVSKCKYDCLQIWFMCASPGQKIEFRHRSSRGFLYPSSSWLLNPVPEPMLNSQMYKSYIVSVSNALITNNNTKKEVRTLSTLLQLLLWSFHLMKDSRSEGRQGTAAISTSVILEWIWFKNVLYTQAWSVQSGWIVQKNDSKG